MPNVNRIRLVGTYPSRDAAASALQAAGDAAIVERGMPRMLMMRCPCGCGDDLVANLDIRSGSAWRLYRRGERLSLYPSYWRDGACGCHFIVWSSRVHWCTWDRDADVDNGDNSDLQDRVAVVLTPEPQHYLDIAGCVDEIPWEVLQACRALVRSGVADEASGRHRGNFRRRPN